MKNISQKICKTIVVKIITSKKAMNNLKENLNNNIDHQHHGITSKSTSPTAVPAKKAGGQVRLRSTRFAFGFVVFSKVSL